MTEGTVKTSVDPRTVIELLQQENAELRMQLTLIRAAQLQAVREAQSASEVSED